MKTNRQSVGAWGENQAAQYLQTLGYQIVECNLRTPYGELDIIARHGETLVFVEVKTRTSRRYGYPEGAVTTTKQQHLIDSAEYYLQSNQFLDCDWRIDVVAIEKLKEGQPPEIRHFENAIYG